MRLELKNGYTNVYNLSENDLDYTVDYINRVLVLRNSNLAKESDIIVNEQPELADDILDDIVWYHYKEESFLFESALWRLQGIFEGILIQRYLYILSDEDIKKLKGLKNKLDKLKNIGHDFNKELYFELLDWNNLRNKLSHLPPQKYTSVLDINDIKEFVKTINSFLKSIK